MAADLTLLSKGRELPLPVDLGETLAGEGEMGEGERVPLTLLNTGDVMLQSLSVKVQGEGAPVIRLAVDVGGQPGVPASHGESITLGTLNERQSADFWMWTEYSPEDVEDLYRAELVVLGFISAEE